MRPSTLIATLSTALLLSLAPAHAATPAAPVAQQAAPARSGLLPVDGVDYHYELHGSGDPLLLLHGGLGAGPMFGPVLDALAKTHTVILVDLQGHGRTALGARPFRIDAMGDDMAAIVKRLGYPRADVMGYSLGGGVALQMAIRQPAQVRKLVLVSTSCSSDAFYRSIGGEQKKIDGSAAAMMKDTPMYKTYAALAPKPDEFPKLLDAIGGFLATPYDVCAEVPKLAGPVMLVYGDGDMYRPESEIAFYQLLGGGKQDGGWNRETLSKNRLAILPNLTHYDIFASPRLAETVEPFLSGRDEVRSWDAQFEQGGKR